MPTFEIHQRGSIRGIPRVGAVKHFLPGNIYETTDSAEVSILRLRPEYVASEILEDGDSDKPVVPTEPVVVEQAEPTELEVAQAKRVFKDELITTPQNKLWLREFSDGSKYKTVWKHGMKKVEFVEKIMEKVYSDA